MAAVTTVLAAASRTMLKYKVTSNGVAAGNIDAAGAATPDLLTDCPVGPLRDLLATAIGSQAAGRALAFDRADLVLDFLSRDADAVWFTEANTDGAGHLRLTLSAGAADALGSYLTIEYKPTLTQ